jgi:hypothetical protein
MTGQKARSGLVHTVVMPIPGSHGTLAELLPAEFVGVPFVAEHYPGAPGITSIEGGANCQLYAYAVLRHFGLDVPSLRASALWSDPRLTTVTDDEQPLDLVLYNASWDSYGAHVAVLVGDDALLHLSDEVGHPVVWTEHDFAQRDRYQIRLGARRVKNS